MTIFSLSFERFPHEISEYIFSYLTTEDIVPLTHVSKSFQKECVKNIQNIFQRQLYYFVKSLKYHLQERNFERQILALSLVNLSPSIKIDTLHQLSLFISYKKEQIIHILQTFDYPTLNKLPTESIPTFFKGIYSISNICREILKMSISLNPHERSIQIASATTALAMLKDLSRAKKLLKEIKRQPFLSYAQSFIARGYRSKGDFEQAYFFTNLIEDEEIKRNTLEIFRS